MQLRTFLLVTSLAAVLLLSSAGGGAHASSYLRSDPDTTCSDTYAKNPSEETCLNTKDHFGRPCEYCTTKSSGNNNIYCYNADEAKWAKFFGGTCEHNHNFGSTY